MHTTVTTLDNRQIKIDMPSVTPDTVKIVPGEGLQNTKVREEPINRCHHQHTFYLIQPPMML